MSEIFKNVPAPKKRYNNFNLSAESLVSGVFGKLIPVQCDEVVPGDRFKQSVSFMMRLAPLSAPAMARFNVHFHSFYVPFRILTPETSQESTYEKFIKAVGKHHSEVPVLPYMYTSLPPSTAGDAIKSTYRDKFNVGSLTDYLGLPVGDRVKQAGFPQSLRISFLPYLCFMKIYNDFYRRDQLQSEINMPVNLHSINLSTGEWDAEFDEGVSGGVTSDGKINPTIADFLGLPNRNYERDYFTSALPEPQFGDEVTIGDGSVNWISAPTSTSGFDIGGVLQTSASGLTNNTPAAWLNLGGKQSFGLGVKDTSVLGNQRFHVGSADDFSVLADHLQANTITINEFRLAMQLQGLLEKINRGGTRYLEMMRSIYGVTVPDARLQRPVYLGGCKSPISIGAVMQTSESDKTPQGTLTGQGTAVGGSDLFSMGYEFKEHGYLMTIMSVTPRTSYYGGIPRKFFKKYPEDFYIPDYDHLGEQEIYKGELYYGRHDQLATKALETFGYTPRYAELKSKLSTVHGEFRTTLDNWHVARDFDNFPSLGRTFIEADNSDFSRIFEFENIENTSNEQFYCQIYFNTVAKRNMSKYSTPYTLY